MTTKSLSKPSNPESVPLLNVENTSVMRADKLALDRFNLEVKQGESLAILGPNGAGKSTLLKLISRELYPLVRPETKLEILGQENFDLREYRQHIGILSQDLQQAYEPSTPGLEVVISGFFASNSLWQHHEVSPEQIQIAQSLISSLEINSLKNQRFGQLSTGQQRRLLLARALVHNPATLILDEPTSGLDVKACFQYLQTINRLLKQGTAIILVTHHLHEIPAAIDRVVLIKDGKNVFDGDKQTALTDTRLSELYDTELQIIEKNGTYQVYPANS